jgi:hypothetical protein
MIKFIIKLALTALVANATWQIGTAYLSHYRFKDAAREAALTPRVTDDQLRARIMELAAENDAPLDDENLVITRDLRHIVVDASYVRSIEAVPGFPYPWQFAWSIEVFIIPGATPPSR